MMKTIVKHFFRGCLVLIPIAASMYFVFWVVRAFDRLVGSPIPGLGVVATVVVVTAAGYLATNWVGRWVVGHADRLLMRLPLVRLIYNSLRDLLGTFVGDKKTFDRPVMVTISRDSGARALGFVTRESMDVAGIDDHVAVYFPQSYNFAGWMLLFPRSDVHALDVRAADLMAFIVSGGVSGRTTR